MYAATHIAIIVAMTYIILRIPHTSNNYLQINISSIPMLQIMVSKYCFRLLHFNGKARLIEVFPYLQETNST
jgi:hypothetical protein